MINEREQNLKSKHKLHFIIHKQLSHTVSYKWWLKAWRRLRSTNKYVLRRPAIFLSNAYWRKTSFEIWTRILNDVSLKARTKRPTRGRKPIFLKKADQVE